MARKDIKAPLTEAVLNYINNNFIELYNTYIKAGKNAEDALNKAENAVADSLLAKETADTTREEMLAIIREQTRNGDLAPEIAQARGGKSTLGERLNSVDSQLSHKADDDKVRKKSIPIGLNDAGSDLLAAIEGGEGTSFEILSDPRNYSVNAKKTTFMEYSTNLYNEDGDLLNTSIAFSTGSLMESENRNATELIDVTDITELTFKGFVRYGLYDYDESRIIVVDTQPSDTVTVDTSNASFIRLVYLHSDIDTQKQVNIGDVLLPYEPFYEKVRDEVRLPQSAFEINDIITRKIDVDFQNGFYYPVNGNFTSDENWRSFKLTLDDGFNSFKVNFVRDGGIRVLAYDNGERALDEFIQFNSEYEVPTGISEIFINIPLETGNPTSSYIQDLKETELNHIAVTFMDNKGKKTIEEKIQELGEAINNASENNEEIARLEQLIYDKVDEIQTENPFVTSPIKLLSVGNSFSMNSFDYIHRLCANVGVDAIFAVLYRGGEDLEGHWDQVQANASSYLYVEYVSENGEAYKQQLSSQTFDYGVNAQDWDIIMFQQGSSRSGLYNTFQPYLNNLIDYVKGVANPNVKIALHMTWAYSTDSEHSGFSNYNNDQTEMFNAILLANQQAMNESDIDLLIPTGTALQNARTNSYLVEVDRELTEDGHHLANTGKFIASLTFFEVLIASRYLKDVFTDVDYTPISKFHSYLGKVSAKNAVLNPFKITEI